MYRIFFVLCLYSFSVVGQNPYKDFSEAQEIRYGSSHPLVWYNLQVDTSDLSVLHVDMRLSHLPDSFLLAMFAHPEYDDRYWRYLEDLHGENGDGKELEIHRLENTLWNVKLKGGTALIHYRFKLPDTTGQRAAWRPFISPRGALIGGPQSYLYVVGATLAPAYVHLQLPTSWQVATGLIPTSDPFTFFAPTIGRLVDGPILAGKFRSWTFSVDGTPHRVVYYSLSKNISFDTVRLVQGIQKLVEQAAAVFGRLPYREYHFLLQDDSYGALEHSNSVTLGATAGELQKNMEEFFGETAHEYFHTWNLMRIRPAEYEDLSYHKPTLSKGLWWSEGLTMFYATILSHRAQLDTSSRLTHLQNLIQAYYSNPVYTTYSAEKISESAYASADYLGDYQGSTHRQGEILGTLLDLIILDATEGHRSMDDVMRIMMDRFSAEKGFTSKDIEEVISETCSCRVHSFFQAYVYSHQQINFAKYLRLMGIEMKLGFADAKNERGEPALDLRVFAYSRQGQPSILLGLINPEGCWGRVGLHTGDELVSINDRLIKTNRDFYTILREQKIGDSVSVRVKRNGVLVNKSFLLSGYQVPSVQLVEIKNASRKQRNLLESWKKSYEPRIASGKYN